MERGPDGRSKGLPRILPVYPRRVIELARTPSPARDLRWSELVKSHSLRGRGSLRVVRDAEPLASPPPAPAPLPAELQPAARAIARWIVRDLLREQQQEKTTG